MESGGQWGFDRKSRPTFPEQVEFKKLEHVLIEKVVQLFQDML
jgi:hypothetical protein